jgi:hypothetical protein
MKHNQPARKRKARSRGDVESREKRIRHRDVAGAQHHLLRVYIAQGDADPAPHASL